MSPPIHQRLMPGHYSFTVHASAYGVGSVVPVTAILADIEPGVDPPA